MAATSYPQPTRRDARNARLRIARCMRVQAGESPREPLTYRSSQMQGPAAADSIQRAHRKLVQEPDATTTAPPCGRPDVGCPRVWQTRFVVDAHRALRFAALQE